MCMMGVVFGIHHLFFFFLALSFMGFSCMFVCIFVCMYVCLCCYKVLKYNM